MPFWGAHAPRVLGEGALAFANFAAHVLITYETSDSETRQRTRRGCLPSALARKRKRLLESIRSVRRGKLIRKKLRPNEPT